MSANCQSKVMEIVEKALQLDVGILKTDSSSEMVDDWDSLGQLSILVALDKHFEGKISGLSNLIFGGNNFSIPVPSNFVLGIIKKD